MNFPDRKVATEKIVSAVGVAALALLTAVSVSLLSAQTLSAQNYPSKPITIVLRLLRPARPATPHARLVGEHLSAAVRQPCRDR